MNNIHVGLIRKISDAAKRFEHEAHSIFSIHDSSTSRIVKLNQAYKTLSGLTITQEDLFKQSFRCLENELYRASHVMSWASFMDFVEEKLGSDNFVKLKLLRPKWSTDSVEELRENTSDYQLIEACKELKLCTKGEMKSLHGLLSKRNECAHPTNYYPNLNESLGYISELLGRIKTLQGRTL